MLDEAVIELKLTRRVEEKVLQPKQRAPQVLRRFHTWRATTCSLLSDSAQPKRDGKHENRRDFSQEHSEKLWDVIRSMSLIRDSVGLSYLHEILDKCIEIDAQFSRQVAYWKWNFPLRTSSLTRRRWSWIQAKSHCQLRDGSPHCCSRASQNWQVNRGWI